MKYIKDNQRVYNRQAIREQLGVSKSKLYRLIKSLPNTQVNRHQNQLFYSEDFLFQIMEKLRNERQKKWYKHK